MKNKIAWFYAFIIFTSISLLLLCYRLRNVESDIKFLKSSVKDIEIDIDNLEKRLEAVEYKYETLYVKVERMDNRLRDNYRTLDNIIFSIIYKSDSENKTDAGGS